MALVAWSVPRSHPAVPSTAWALPLCGTRLAQGTGGTGSRGWCPQSHLTALADRAPVPRSQWRQGLMTPNELSPVQRWEVTDVGTGVGCEISPFCDIGRAVRPWQSWFVVMCLEPGRPHQGRGAEAAAAAALRRAGASRGGSGRSSGCRRARWGRAVRGWALCRQGQRGRRLPGPPLLPPGTGAVRRAGGAARLSGQGWTLSSFCQSFVKLPPCSSRRFQQRGVGGCVGSAAAPEIILRVRGASGAAGRLCPLPAAPPGLRGAASVCLSPRLPPPPPPSLDFSFPVSHFPSR